MTKNDELAVRVTALEERVNVNEQAVGLADHRYNSLLGGQDVILQILREQGAELQAIRVEHGAMLRDHGGKLGMIVAFINQQST